MHCVVCLIGGVSEHGTHNELFVWGGFSLCGVCFVHFMKRREVTRHRAEPDFVIIDWGRANLKEFLKEGGRF